MIKRPQFIGQTGYSMGANTMQQFFSNEAGLFAGKMDRAQIAAVMGCCERSIIRREREGMPVIKVGKLRLYDTARVRAWIEAQEVTPSAPKRGRPRKS